MNEHKLQESIVLLEDILGAITFFRSMKKSTTESLMRCIDNGLHTERNRHQLTIYNMCEARMQERFDKQLEEIKKLRDEGL